MTSGEALWLDIRAGRFPAIRSLFPITAAPGDAERWAEGLQEMSLARDVQSADAILLMGLPDDASADPAIEPVLAAGLQRQLPLFCSNPDKASPRQGGRLVRSPGSLAEAYEKAGGRVHYYGKPHLPVFESLQGQLGISDPRTILMIGDSIEHDMAGAASAGWNSLLITGGLHAAELTDAADREAMIATLCQRYHCPLPDFHMESVAT
jgi:HAD superfamily hydrolase (TIGR01459 family)